MFLFNIKRTHFINILAAIGLLISPATFAADTNTSELQLGSVAMDVPTEMVKRLTPLTQYLTQKIGSTVSFRASPNLDSAVEDLGSNTTQIAYLTPAAYLEAREKYSVLPLVNPLNNGKGSFTLMIVVADKSNIHTIADLRGKTFAFGDKKAILQPAVVENSGIKLNEFASVDYLNHYDNIAKAVLNGDFDAGILKDAVAEKYATKGLRIIYTSTPLPSYIFATNKNISPITFEKLKKAMLDLNKKSNENKEILSSLERNYDGIEIAKDKDFDGIRKLLAHKK